MLKLTDFIFRVTSSPGSNIYFVNTSPAVIIDTGHPALEQQTIELLSKSVPIHSVRYILCTHSHPDHIGANARLKELTGAQIIGLPPENNTKLTVENRKELNLLCSTSEIDRIVRDQTVIQLNDESIQVLHTPGHSDDHLCFFLKSKRMLFTGDLITNQDLGYLNLNRHYSTSLEDISHSVKKCKDLDPSLILPGHGDIVGVNNTLWKGIERKLVLFRKNPGLLISHVLISPLIFFLSTKKMAAYAECEEYVLDHTYIFDGFIENCTAEVLSEELKKLVYVLTLKSVLIQDNGLLFLNSQLSNIDSKWIY